MADAENTATGPDAKPTMPLVVFDPSEAHIQQYRSEIAATVAEAKAYLEAKEARQLTAEELAKFKPPRRELVRMRNQIDTGRKKMNADALAWQRNVNSLAQKYTAMMVDDERALDAAIARSEKIEKDAAEAIIRAEEEKKAAEAKRVADELAAAQKLLREKEEAEREEARRKLAEERAAFAEQQRLAKVEEERQLVARQEEQARQEAMRKVEQEKIEEAKRKLREEQDRLAAEQRKLQEDKEAAERKEKDRLLAEAQAEAKKLKDEADAKAREAQRIADEEAERVRLEKEKAEAEAQMPDKSRINLFGFMLSSWIEANQPAGFGSAKAKKFISDKMTALRGIATTCKEYK